MQLKVNPSQRYAKMRAHTATHLLHSELGKIFPTTKQAGSLVDSDYLRFDFYADRLLDNTEVETIERNINQIIYDSYEVSIKELAKSEAEQLGAKMFFEDKYGDVVRVVSIAQTHTNNWEFLSIELCGGTHVANTKDIGICKIIWQQAVASGVKRIIALVWPKVYDFIAEQNATLQTIAMKLECNTSQIIERLEKLVDNYQFANKTLESINATLLLSLVYESKTSENNGESISYQFCNLSESVLSHSNLKDITGNLKSIDLKGTYLFTDKGGGFLIRSSEGKAKSLMNHFGRKWGWNEVLCQGKAS